MGISAITSQLSTDSYAGNTLLIPKCSNLIPRQLFKFLVYPQVVPSSGALAKRMCPPRGTSELTGEGSYRCLNPHRRASAARRHDTDFQHIAAW